MIWKYRVTLIGGLVGPIWWPAGRMCSKLLVVDLGREAVRMDDPTLRDLLLHVVKEQGGDFQSCDFTEDTQIVVTRERQNETRVNTVSRHWPITAFKSVRDLVKLDTYSPDYE